MNLDTNEKLIFLHIPKTAGTTLYDHLTDFFKKNQIFPDRYPFDINKYSFKEIDSFKFFSGHFTKYHCDLIPDPKKIITFLRSPKERVLSLYYFWRSHTWDIINKNNLNGPKMAKNLDLLNFLKEKSNGIPANIDNVYVQTLLGPIRFSKDGGFLYGDKDYCVEKAFEYLKTFFFVGFQENFDKDFHRLCNKLSIPNPIQIEKRNSFESFNKRPGMERVERQEITAEIEYELQRVTRYDQILYEKAKQKWYTP